MKLIGLRVTYAATAAVFSFLFAFLDTPAFAMNWPVENAVIVRNFGSNDKGRPQLGMIFRVNAVGSPVLTAEKGEVIFRRDKNDTASRLPSPLGAWTAVDHGDGLISIYSRYAERRSVDLSSVELSPAEQDLSELKTMEKRQPIASAGISGWSSQNGFYFMIYDRRERRWINPEMILTPLRETRSPQILSMDFRNAQGLSMQGRSFSQGRYTIIVNAGTPPLAPQRIVCLVNGSEAGSLNFEAVSARDGVLMVYRNGLVPARQIYANFPAFEAAEIFLNRGQVTLEIIVQDIAGNSRNTVSRMIVN